MEYLLSPVEGSSLLYMHLADLWINHSISNIQKFILDIKPSFSLLTILALVKLNVLVAIAILSVFQLSAGLQISCAQDIIIEKSDLCDTWQVFNQEKKTYQKLGFVGRSKSIRFTLVLEENANGWLEIIAPRGTAMLINGQYVGRIDNKSVIELDSLLNTYNRNVFDFTLFRNVYLNHSNLTTMLYQRVTPQESDPSVTRSSQDDFMNFYVLISLLILGYAGFLAKKFPRDILDYFSFQRSLSFKNRKRH